MTRRLTILRKVPKKSQITCEGSAAQDLVCFSSAHRKPGLLLNKWQRQMRQNLTGPRKSEDHLKVTIELYQCRCGITALARRLVGIDWSNATLIYVQSRVCLGAITSTVILHDLASHLRAHLQLFQGPSFFSTDHSGSTRLCFPISVPIRCWRDKTSTSRH